VVYSMKPFFDILTALAKEHNQAKHLVKEYEAQLEIFKEKEKLVSALINNVSAGSLSQALRAANDYKTRNPLSDPCPTGSDCPPEKQGLKNLFDSWDPMVTLYINTITNYQSQTDPDLTSFLAQLENEQAGLKQQIDLLPGIINQMEEIQKDMADADAAIILDPNFSFYNFSDEVWRLLNTYFPDVFNTKNSFYFIPQGTNYQVCVDTQYTGPIPASPQTVCSTISYTPSVWGPNTAFAKACTTFTPQ
ncbi:MAG: hypothetical protein U1C50_01080, partial [Patescibacteria group bacterium]|nr:hypothetical protein [Patescibacteria group bacterium]